MSNATVRLATPRDAHAVATMLDDFNREFDDPSPGVDVLAERLEVLLGGPTTLATLAADPDVGLALVTLRTNVWYRRPVALLDEMYVAPAERGGGIGTAVLTSMIAILRRQRVPLVEVGVDESDTDARWFYEQRGFSAVDPDSGERASYLYRELGED